MSRRVGTGARLRRDDSGQSLVITVMCLGVLMLCAILAVDTAHWFVHKRHLQTQADAGALAAARELQFPCGATAADAPNPAVIAAAHKYDGWGIGAFNPQIATAASAAPTSKSVYDASSHDIFSLVNAPNFVNQSTPNDTDLTGDPCKDKAVDLKLTETNLPVIFKVAQFFGIDPPNKVQYINAQARVSLERLLGSAGAAPIAIQSSTPNSVYATFIDEANGNASLGGAELTSGDQGQTWATTSPIPVSFNGVGSRIGVRIGLSGQATAGPGCTTTTLCFDSTSPNNGVSFVHTWNTQTPTADNPTGAPGIPTGAGKTPFGPEVREVWLTGSGGTPCLDPTFNNTASNCTVQLHANLRFKAADLCNNTPKPDVVVGLTINGTSSGNMTCPTGGNASGEWTSDAITITPNSGPKTFQFDYTLQGGEQKPAGATGGNNKNPSICTSGGGNQCTNNGVTNGFGTIAQRIWAAAPDLASAGSSRSSSMSNVSVTDASTGATLVNDSVQRCSGAATCTKNLNVTVSIYPLATTTDIKAAAINLRNSDPQGNGAINCGQGTGASKFQTALINGCPSTLTKAPSGATSAICATQPTSCVSVVPGQGKVTDALDQRIACRSGCANGDGSVGQASIPATKCDNPNFWTTPNVLAKILGRTPQDPRLVQLIIVPYGALLPNGSYSVPIKDFASFYITGYDATGSQNTCGSATNAGTYASSNEGVLAFTPDTPATTNEIWGHFVVYNETSAGGTGAGEGTCNSAAASDCIAVLTK